MEKPKVHRLNRSTMSLDQAQMEHIIAEWVCDNYPEFTRSAMTCVIRIGTDKMYCGITQVHADDTEQPIERTEVEPRDVPE